MSNVVLLDTSVLVDQLRTGRHQERIESVTGLVRTSSVVLAELWRGATKPAERDFLHALEKNYPVLVPTKQNWIESGELLNELHQVHGFLPQKLRDLHFDVLIALTARSHEARLITSNRTEFELIASVRPVPLEIW
jgi:predicted nucleic acid-binding protein